MKSEQETSVQIESSFMIEQPTNEPNTKCTSGNEAFEYCFNENCSNTKIFLCGIRKCKCRQQHGLCPKADLDFTLQHVNSKLIDTTQMRQTIETSFDKLIDHLSELRDSITAQLDDKIKYNLLHDIERKFLQATSLHSKENFSSKQSAKLWNVINTKYVARYDLFSEIKCQMKSFNQFVTDLSVSVRNSIQKIFQKQQLVQVNKDDNANAVKENLYQFFKGKSSILLEQQHFQKLQNFFVKKPIGAELIFKASEHQFDLKKYYELCGDVTQTMIICKTNKDKILGGYSPIAFNPPSNKMEYATDESNESMIFSLSENDKFELKDKLKAVRHMPDKTHLRIGNAEFDICDKADTVQQCYTYLTNQFYNNPKYKNDKDSYMRLNGNESFKFMTKEWEVWKMDFRVKQD